MGVGSGSQKLGDAWWDLPLWDGGVADPQNPPPAHTHTHTHTCITVPNLVIRAYIKEIRRENMFHRVPPFKVTRGQRN